MALTQELLKKINGLTKYPSIPTYHGMGERGILNDTTVDYGDSEVVLTEKIDGTNARIVITPDEPYLIGSREELLYAEGDLIVNPTLGIVETLIPIADELRNFRDQGSFGSEMLVFYGEVYGVGVNKKHSTYINRDVDERPTSFRLFDVAVVMDWQDMAQKSREDIALWRERGGQSFLNYVNLRDMSSHYELKCVPPVALVKGSDLPKSHDDTLKLLENLCPVSIVNEKVVDKKEPEGLVARTPDRSVISKLRFEDYRRVLRVKK